MQHDIPRDTSVIHQYIDGPKFALYAADTLATGLESAGIPFVDGNTGFSFEALRCLVIAVICGRDRVPGRLQRTGDCSPDASSAAGHNCDSRHG
jgi:hypothetical protein